MSIGIRERLFGSKVDSTTLFAAIDDEWRTAFEIVDRAGYHPLTVIYTELLRLEREGAIKSCLRGTDGGPRRFYRRAVAW